MIYYSNRIFFVYSKNKYYICVRKIKTKKIKKDTIKKKDNMDMTMRHLNNMKKIEDFLTSNNILFRREEKIFFLNDDKLEIRYVDSENHKMDYEKRFGIKGIPHNYFINITKANKEKGIRTMWIKDWEIEEQKTIVDIDGVTHPDYDRKWKVLQSYIKTGTGHIENRYFARDCEIKKLTNKELRPFLEENSFYGYRSANVNLGLYAKKDKGNIKAGTLLMIYTFGHPFFGKNLYDVEVIRVATKLNCQVMGGASKLLANFLTNYPTLNIGEKTITVNKIVFIVDADHNDAKSLESLGFTFVSYNGNGFMNVEAETGKVFHRQPMHHKLIMERMAKGEVYSVANAGSIIYTIDRNEYLQKIK